MAREYRRMPLYAVALAGIILLLTTLRLYLLGSSEGADAGGCKTIYMYPSFARIKSFDESHTQYASKYSLYLYREQGKDTIPQLENEGFRVLDGIPALFIPGNAGSYRQVRSIAAECSNLYFDDNINVVNNPHARNYDFFAADFNEDFTAFHGRTLLDQAEYLNQAVAFILLLYANNPNPPESVLILAHSMGGIVARVMPTLHSYYPGSINTIVTLASPHAAAPLTFDGGISKVYLAADRFWYEAFNTDDHTSLEYSRLHNVSVISITGGLLDNILPADYTALGYLIPPTNGFTVYTSGIPEVWTPMDHLAIVWCRQLRRTILKTLLEIANFSSPHRTYPLEKRMSIFRDNLLSGFEEYKKKDSDLRNPARADAFRLKFDLLDLVSQKGPNSVWKSTEAPATDRSFVLFPIGKESTVLFLSDQKLTPWDDAVVTFDKPTLSVMLCTREGNADRSYDFTGSSTNEFMEFVCIDISKSTNIVPRSSSDVSLLDHSAFDGEKDPYHAFYLSPEDLLSYENLVVVRKGSQPLNGFAVVLLSDQKSAEYTVGEDLFTLIRRGVDVSVMPSRPLAVNFYFPGAWSSILAYKLKMKEASGNLFEPFIRQWKDEPYETKWHINLRGEKEVLLSMHGIAPYTPFKDQSPSPGLNLQVWADVQNTWSDENVSAVDMIITVDWLSSLKLLVLRYRLAVVSHCLAISVLALIFQLYRYSNTGKFPDYLYGLSRLADPDVFVFFTVVLSALTPLVKKKAVQLFLDLVDPVVLQDGNEMNLSLHEDFVLNSFYLGLQENCLFPLGCLFYIAAIGINFLLYNVVTFTGILVVLISRQVAKVGSRFKSKATESNEVLVKKVLKRKVIATAIIIGLIPLQVPYQLAFVIAFCMQIITCIKTLWNKSTASSMWNYQISFLMVMAWVLPINIPVLVVYVHNLNVDWATPFSSHHNFLAVAPILVLAELHSFYSEIIPIGGLVSNDALAKKGKSLNFLVTVGILGYMVAYSLLYGVRHTFWLHHLFNIWCCWVIVMFLSRTGNGKVEKHQ